MTHLKNIIKITGTITLKTGLHIGGSNNSIKIGGIDSEVVKNPITNYPMIPGASIKGKIRSLLEWKCGHGGEKPLGPGDVEKAKEPDLAENILRLFGTSADSENPKYGISRLSFYDCDLDADWAEKNRGNNALTASLTEEKSENVINRISGQAEHPRFIERTPAGAEFDFTIAMRVFADDNTDALLNTLLSGMKLLTYDALGGSGSRGYGKVEFSNLTQNSPDDIQNQFDKIDPFAQ